MTVDVDFLVSCLVSPYVREGCERREIVGLETEDVQLEIQASGIIWKDSEKPDELFVVVKLRVEAGGLARLSV